MVFSSSGLVASSSTIIRTFFFFFFFFFSFIFSTIPQVTATAAAATTTSTATTESCCTHDSGGLNAKAAAERAQNLAGHHQDQQDQHHSSWEYGIVSSALLELYNPRLSVFSPQAFPAGKLPRGSNLNPSLVPALAFAKRHLRLDYHSDHDNNKKNNILIHGHSNSDQSSTSSLPSASLGVAALMIGQSDSRYTSSAKFSLQNVFDRVPQWVNGAISHQESYAELWAEFIYTAPPFMAYYAVATNNTDWMDKAMGQCRAYRQALQPNNTSKDAAAAAGAWQHILGPEHEDLGLWATGNGWAAMGMARVLATLLHWPRTALSAPGQKAQADLFSWIGEILRAAMTSPKEKGLLGNYLHDSTWFGEVGGTALLTAAVYRVAALQEEASASAIFHGGGAGGGAAGAEKQLVRDTTHPGIEKPVSPQMLHWANENLLAITAHVTSNNDTARPCVNPLDWRDRAPWADADGSAAAESFLVMLYAAWRDCVVVGGGCWGG